MNDNLSCEGMKVHLLDVASAPLQMHQFLVSLKSFQDKPEYLLKVERLSIKRTYVPNYSASAVSTSEPSAVLGIS